jgi:hypothetical protein
MNKDDVEVATCHKEGDVPRKQKRLGIPDPTKILIMADKAWCEPVSPVAIKSSAHNTEKWRKNEKRQLKRGSMQPNNS